MKKKRNSGGGNKKASDARVRCAIENLTIPDDKVFCENATIARHHVKRKIIQRISGSNKEDECVGLGVQSTIR